MSWQQTREDVLERDGYECRFCGMTNDEHEAEYDRGLHAHHILKDREGGRDHEENLITVCKTCHETLEHTHAKAIAEVKRETEPDTSAETKLQRLAYVWQSATELADGIDDRLADYVDNNPLTADALGAHVERGGEVDVYDLRTAGECVGTESLDSEFQFAAVWGYNQAVSDLLTDLEDADPEIRSRETQRGRVKNIKELIAQIERENGGDAPINKILDRAEEKFGYERSTAEHEVEKLRRQGDVYEPKTDHLRTV